ncbi:patatin-like phospholipase family protein [Sphingomonas sp. CGMCC 1.13654]|uniref:Patatin-like phospholipase family protein n=1 Tax=Sphingomonas chungangi TaxID=2683589 RepID=A0A838L1Y2_9SPHN|nr:patatin-like phospholipase family protein [Sphingomonas chungangi]MBA2933503.1 patatin-like phospholipase family protein [Sphingomonas chungangi]MVW54836.1 patatin-like phospholipase family protein [Sphingomonas chungangi]
MIDEAEVPPASPSRALVLGGGGPVGRAFHWGLCAGLLDAGIDLRTADLIVGTSAGAIVGAQLALQIDPRHGPPIIDGYATSPRSDGAAAAMQALMVGCARAVGSPHPEAEWREIGALAMAAETVSEDTALARPSVEAIAGQPWPTNFRATAIDARSGEFRIWGPSDSVPLDRACASSAALPGVWPPISICGSQYVDGGVRSMLNADTAKGFARVIVISCFDLSSPIEAPAPIRILNEALRHEIEQLRDHGSMVEVISPDLAFLALTGFGSRMLDNGLVPEAYRLARSQALRERDHVQAVWLATPID